MYGLARIYAASPSLGFFFSSFDFSFSEGGLAVQAIASRGFGAQTQEWLGVGFWLAGWICHLWKTCFWLRH